MQVIKSEILGKFPEIIFGFSTKIGLNREAPFYFNTSKSVPDDLEIVEQNRIAFCSEIGITNQKVCFQKQIHSDIVTKVDENYKMLESDALYTKEAGYALAISSADCVPIFLYDPIAKIIAGVHSGWKGTAQNILTKTIEKIIEEGAKPGNLLAYIGPCISGDNYQVGEEVANQFNSKYIRKLKNKMFLDLKAANLDFLINAGLHQTNIEMSDLCSFQEEKLLHSYRRDGKVSGRAIGVICIRGENIVT